MTRYVTLPGIGNSGKTHWQTLWEEADPAFARFAPADWDAPDLGDWSAALDRAINACGEPPVLVAHSLACLLVPHWRARSSRRVAAAFLVAVPDPASAAFPAEAKSFSNVPEAPLPFPSLVVASSNDPYGSIDDARRRSARWGSGFVEVGALGHINGASGLGDWPQGRAMLDAFAAGLCKAA